MKWRKLVASILGHDDLDNTHDTSNVQLIGIGATFAAVIVALLFLQAEHGTGVPGMQEASLSTEQDLVAPAASLRPTAPTEAATRSQASLLGPIGTATRPMAVSQQLRQPLRLTDTDARRTDLRSVTASVLQGFGHTPDSEDRLMKLLVQALSEQQSNAYIDALLNTAAGRGEFAIPERLMLSNGRLDTDTVLMALVEEVSS